MVFMELLELVCPEDYFCAGTPLNACCRYAPFFRNVDLSSGEMPLEFMSAYKEFIGFQEEFLQPFLDAEGQTFDDFGEYAKVPRESAPSRNASTAKAY